MPFDGSPFDGSPFNGSPSNGFARPPGAPIPRHLPPEVMTWTPRAFSVPVSTPAVEWGRFLVALGGGLVVFGGLSLLLLGL